MSVPGTPFGLAKATGYPGPIYVGPCHNVKLFALAAKVGLVLILYAPLVSVFYAEAFNQTICSCS